MTRDPGVDPYHGDQDTWPGASRRPDQHRRQGVPGSSGGHGGVPEHPDRPSLAGRTRAEERRRRRGPQVLGGQDVTQPPAGEEPVNVVPVRRFLSLVIAGFALLVALSLVLGAHTNRSSHAVVVFGMQALFVVVWVIASRPPAPRVVVGVGLTMAIGTNIAVVMVRQTSLEPLAYLTAAGFVLGVVGQLMRPAGRVRVTESLGSSLVIILGVVAFATLIELTRHAKGTQALSACIGAAGVAVAVARFVDTILPIPRVAPQVPRGGLGVVLGAMAGTGFAAIAGYYLDGLESNPAALAGLATALVAVMVDLSIGYAEASRHVEEEQPTLWLARHMQGPLGAIAFAAPVAYAASVLLLHLL